MEFFELLLALAVLTQLQQLAQEQHCSPQLAAVALVTRHTQLLAVARDRSAAATAERITAADPAKAATATSLVVTDRLVTDQVQVETAAVRDRAVETAVLVQRLLQLVTAAALSVLVVMQELIMAVVVVTAAIILSVVEWHLEPEQMELSLSVTRIRALLLLALLQ